MKKLLAPVLAVAVFATLAYAGENYFHTIKAEFGAFASRLGIGMSEPSASYTLDVAGASRVVGSVAVATSATSGYSLVFKGATVTLSTQPTSVGQMWLQTSDLKVYISTRVPAANDPACALAACYSALN